jgi:WD40 repeat protein
MQIGRYEVQKILGQGGMGRVLLARDPSRGADVAIKLLLKADSADARARFEREQRLLAALGEKEGFVPILDQGESQGRPFLVMPFITGGTLRERFARGPLPVDAAVALVAEIAAAVARAHAVGIVHRDLKPENVIFTAGGRPLVADLGLAKHFLDATPGASRSVSLTQAGELRGSAGYMAPEQMRDARSAGPPADVFALGALLYEALAGEPAFQGESALEVIGKVDSGEVRPLAQVRPDTPGWLAGVVARAIATAPGERFEDAAAFARALEARAETGRPAIRLLLPAVTLAVLAAGAAALLLRVNPVKPIASADPPRADPGVAPVASAASSPASIPAECRGFLASPRMKLVDVFGSYALKLPGPATGVAISPDGTRALTGDSEGRLWLWDLATFGVIRALEASARGAEAAPCRSPVFLPDGKRAVSGSDDGFFRIWDLESGVALAKLPGEQGAVYSIAVSSDGKTAATGGSDSTVRLWDLVAMKAVATLRSDTTDLVKAVSFSRNGELLIAASEKVVALWDVPNGQRLRWITQVGGTAVALSADGSQVLVGLRDGSVRLLASETMAEIGHLTGHRGEVTKVALLPGEKRAVTASADGTLELWDLPSASEVRSFKGHGDRVDDVAVSADGRRILSGSRDQQAILWDAATGKDLRGPVGPGGPVLAVALARSARLALAGGADGLLRLFDSTSGRLVRTLGAHESRIAAVALSADGKSALSGSADGLLELWDTGTGRERFSIKAHESGTRSVAFLDAQLVVSGGEDGSISSWDERGAPRMTYDSMGGPVVGLASTGKYLFVGCDSSRDGTAHSLGLVEIETGVVERKPSKSSNPLGAIALSSDARTGVTGALDGTLRVWDMHSRTAKQSFPVHAGAVTAVAAGADFLLSAGVDGTIRLTSMKGEALDRISLASADDHVLSLALALDERAFTAGTARGVVLRFELLRP